MREIATTSAILAMVLCVGCGAPEADFQQNHVYILKQKNETGGAFTDPQRKDLANVMEALFGTPDKPHIPQTGTDTTSLFQENKLLMAAGPYGSYEDGRPRGLYREHCVHCHGVTGDGKGPTAQFLNPYPRDYRLGKFKFKSTPDAKPPTHDDLRLILYNGIPDTAMPSFKLLPADELEALIQYARYLSIRGKVERELIFAMAEFGEEERLFDATSAVVASKKATEVADIVNGVLEEWVAAELASLKIPPAPPKSQLAESVAKGKALFYGDVAGCVKCHGDSALGDGQKTDYDDWAKDYFDPKKPNDRYQYMALGAHEPRNIIPRNLRAGVYRGGRRPIDLYRRIANGITGTPMPKAPASLPPEDIWHLVNYVRSLPRETTSDPYQHVPVNNRERN
ncbi:MAG: mono/diheme cytochrome c family protein [Pirellulaceae bacterium]|jgi:mono/diheme cytochrome c family protein